MFPKVSFLKSPLYLVQPTVQPFTSPNFRPVRNQLAARRLDRGRDGLFQSPLGRRAADGVGGDDDGGHLTTAAEEPFQ